MEVTCFYFGCLPKRAMGHYLYSKIQGVTHQIGFGESGLPFNPTILDAALLKNKATQVPQTQGLVRRVVIAGWTILTFWDRTGDTRHGSNSAFVVDGDFDFDTCIKFAKLSWPELFDRIERHEVSLQLEE